MTVATIEKTNFSPADVIAALSAFTKSEWDEVLAWIRSELPTTWAEISSPNSLVEPQVIGSTSSAAAAIERMAGMFPISDPQLGQWLAHSPELSLYGDYMDDYS